MAYEAGPFDTPHWYVQWGGKLPGNEQWSCGLRMAIVNSGTAINDPAMQAGVAAAVQAFHISAGASISAAAKLSFVKVNLVGTDGRYVAPTTSETIVADVGGSGSSAPAYPNQVALAVSLTTAFSRGPAHRGRFYVPLPSFGLDGAGTISSAAATQMKGAATDLLTALNAVDNNSTVAVFSRKLGAPAHNIVTGIEVGRVYDTQRRRRRSLVENYS